MNRVRSALAATAATLSVCAAVTETAGGSLSAQMAAEIESGRDHLSAVELAERIARGDSNLQIFDLRSESAYEAFHLPMAVHISIPKLLARSLAPGTSIVLYSEGGAHAAQTWALLRMRGYRQVYFLREGVYEWVSTVLEPRLATDATTKERLAFERAAQLSRFFGGNAQSDVPRSQVPGGYWTGLSQDVPQPDSDRMRSAADVLRRRGC